MKFYHPFIGLILAILYFGCSNDDNAENNDIPTAQIPDFTLIGEDLDAVYQYQYDRTLDTGTIVNLTAEDNVNENYITLRQVSQSVSFFSISQGRFSLVQRDLATGMSLFFEDFYTIFPEQAIIWGATSETQIFMAYYSPPASGEFGLRIIDMATGNFVDMMLASNVFDTTEPLYFNQRLFMAYLDNTFQYKMIVLDTESLTVLRSFDFGDDFPSILIDEADELLLIKGEASTSFDLEFYDVQTMDLIATDGFELPQFFTAGPLNAYFGDQKLYYQNILPQPSVVTFAPAVLDLSDNSNTVTDMNAIVNAVRQEIDGEISLTVYGFDPVSKNFLIGYEETANEIIGDGGVIVIDQDGTLIGVVELPFVPTYFVKS